MTRAALCGPFERKCPMSKKLISTALALFALAAFVLPAIASAQEPEVTFPTGTRLATATKVTGTNIGEFLMTDEPGNVLARCTKATLTGTLTKNDGKTSKGPSKPQASKAPV